MEIYVYFLNFDPKDPDKFRREREERAAQAAPGDGQHQLHDLPVFQAAVGVEGHAAAAQVLALDVEKKGES